MAEGDGVMTKKLAARTLLALALAAGACSGSGSGGGALPPAAACGDGVVNGTEECDDGNQSDADACLNTCLKPATWVASDPHIHGHGCGGALSPRELLDLSAKQGNQVIAALVWGDGYRDDRRYFTGQDDPASGGGHIIHYDLEVSHFPAAETGHLVLLGLSSINFSSDPFSSPRSGIPILDWAHGQGERVVAGMAHGEFWPPDGHFPSPPQACCMPYDLVPDVVTGRVSFFETERGGGGPPIDTSTMLLSQKLLNTGFKLAWAGASDYPCIHHVLDGTTPRTDVLLPGELTYDRWLEAMRAGRTAVAVAGANHLDLRVNGAPIGSEVHVASGDTLTLAVESDIGVPDDVTILANGRPVASAHVEAGHQSATLQLEASGSMWLMASSRYVMTSPTYVIAGGAAIRASADDACYLLRYIDHLEGLVRTRLLDLGSDQHDAMANYDAARQELAKRFSEAGGTTCP